MRSPMVDRDFRLLFWQRVREYAVPVSMIESATVRRRVGDWAGACSAARVDVDLNLVSAAEMGDAEHTTFRSLIGKRVRVTIEEIR